MKYSIQWTEELCVGLKDIDVQHEYLAALINDILTCAHKGCSIQETLGHLDHMLAYAKWHFDCEEALMGMYNYSGLSPHKHEHQSLMAAGEQLRETITTKWPMDNAELYSLCFDWFAGHAFSADRAAAVFIKKQRGNLIP